MSVSGCIELFKIVRVLETSHGDALEYSPKMTSRRSWNLTGQYGILASRVASISTKQKHPIQIVRRIPHSMLRFGIATCAASEVICKHRTDVYNHLELRDFTRDSSLVQTKKAPRIVVALKIVKQTAQ